MNPIVNYKRPLLYSLVCSVIIAALLSLAFVALNTWGWWQVRAVVTLTIVAAASVCGLACSRAGGSQGWRVMSVVGCVLTAACAAQLLALTWLGLEVTAGLEAAAVTGCFAVATTHACLLSTASLSRRFRWVRLIAYQAIYGLAALVSVMVFGYLIGEGTFRCLLALSILNTSLTLVIPLLHRISQTEVSETSEPISPSDDPLFGIDTEIANLNRQLADLHRRRSELTGSEGLAMSQLPARTT